MSELDPLPEANKRKVGAYVYSRVEEAEKEAAIKQAMRDFPNTPGGEVWAEWVYDFIKQDPDEFRRRVDAGEYDKPPPKYEGLQIKK